MNRFFPEFEKSNSGKPADDSVAYANETMVNTTHSAFIFIAKSRCKHVWSDCGRIIDIWYLHNQTHFYIINKFKVLVNGFRLQRKVLSN